MARYSSNFGNKLQMMVGMGKECGFMSKFYMPRSFATRETKLRCKMANSQSDCRTAPWTKSNELTLGTRLYLDSSFVQGIWELLAPSLLCGSSSRDHDTEERELGRHLFDVARKSYFVPSKRWGEFTWGDSHEAQERKTSKDSFNLLAEYAK